MSQALRKRVEKALENDNTIVIDRKDLHNTQGFSTEYMEFLGLSKTDLKKLERKGLALRGYSKNLWLPGEKMPNGRVCEEGVTYRGQGHRLRWILVTDGDTDVREVQQEQGRESGEGTPGSSEAAGVHGGSNPPVRGSSGV